MSIESSSGSSRFFRGGYWYDLPLFAGVAIRGCDAPGFRFSFYGVRFARRAP